jgi:hypothetical protein
MTNQPKAAKGQVQVHVPADLSPSYANFALVTNSASEIVMDFAQVMPRVPRANVNTRVVMTALNAKLFLRALSEHVARYESQFGEITLPEGPHLAEQLFKPEKPDAPDAE